MTGHAFNQIMSDIKNGALPGVVLLYGVEQFLVGWAKDRIIDEYVNEATRSMDLTVFETGEFTADELGRLSEAVGTFPMFSERKVVVIEGYSDVWNHKSDFLVDVINDVPSHAILVITAPEPPQDKRQAKSALKDALASEGGLYDFEPLDEDSLKKFISKRIRAYGKGISPIAMNTLLQTSGYFNKDIDYALFNLENDVKKMVAHASSEEITEADVISAVSDNLEHNTFKMLDAISSNNKERAFTLLNDMLRFGTPAQRILAVICGQLELMLMVKELSGQGMNRDQIKKETKAHEYRIKKAQGFASPFSVKDLKRINMKAFDVDNQIKSGLLDEQLALEMLIASI